MAPPAPSPPALPLQDPDASLARRQLWNLPTPGITTSSVCPNFTLPVSGSIIINPTSTLTLTSTVVYQPPCTGSFDFVGITNQQIVTAIDGPATPFYASVSPLVYVISATTVIAYTLLILVLIQPGASGVSQRQSNRGWVVGRFPNPLSFFTNRSTVVGRGSRPVLQKIAAFLVCASMTTVSADLLRHAKEQYSRGYSDASVLRQQTIGSVEVRVIRVVSDLFLWLAQIQTLIRLFPRHKEQLVIKWVGFLLLCLDIIFSCMNSFLFDPVGKPRSYRDAIPALSYLFQLSLNLLYASWVLYYAITKRRYAFYHPAMPNISIVALISIVSLLIPCTFFLVDILQQEVGSWGDYFRWTGSAAASIVVWEWVDRIEALEGEEKRDGILGREVYEEDDMIHSVPSDSSDSRPGSSRTRSTFANQRRRLAAGVGKVGNFTRRYTDRSSGKTYDLSEKSREFRKRGSGSDGLEGQEDYSLTDSKAFDSSELSQIPGTTPSPQSHSNEREKAALTVHYNPNNADTTARPEPAHLASQPGHDGSRIASSTPQKSDGGEESSRFFNPEGFYGRTLSMAMNLFKRNTESPPAVIKMATAAASTMNSIPEAVPKARDHTRKFRRRKLSNASHSPVLPTVIPAPARNSPWSPDSLRDGSTVDSRHQSPATVNTVEQRIDEGFAVRDFGSTSPRPAPTPPTGPTSDPPSRTPVQEGHERRETRDSSDRSSRIGRISEEQPAAINTSAEPEIR